MTKDPARLIITESRPTDLLAVLHESAAAEKEYLFAARDADPTDIVLVAWDGKDAVGYIAATDEREHGLLIWEHLVVPSHRTNGLGKRLLGELARRALPGAVVVVDPLGGYDIDRISDYYGSLGFACDDGGRIRATVDEVIRATPIPEPAGSERSVPIRTLLDRKGSGVVSIGPEASVAEAISLLNRHGIGALVVSTDGNRVEGIVSERDILVGLDQEGAGFLDRGISNAITSDVLTCTPDDPIAVAMESMTRLRVRHLPITETGQLAGIISLGDLVSFRLARVEGGEDH